MCKAWLTASANTARTPKSDTIRHKIWSYYQIVKSFRRQIAGQAASLVDENPQDKEKVYTLIHDISRFPPTFRQLVNTCEVSPAFGHMIDRTHLMNLLKGQGLYVSGRKHLRGRTLELTTCFQLYYFILTDVLMWWEKFSKLSRTQGKVVDAKALTDGLKIVVSKKKGGKSLKDAPVTLLSSLTSKASLDWRNWDGTDGFREFGGWGAVSAFLDSRSGFQDMVKSEDGGNHFWWGDHLIPSPSIVFQENWEDLKEYDEVLRKVSAFQWCRSG